MLLAINIWIQRFMQIQRERRWKGQPSEGCSFANSQALAILGFSVILLELTCLKYAEEIVKTNILYFSFSYKEFISKQSLFNNNKQCKFISFNCEEKQLKKQTNINKIEVQIKKKR